jgi:hypothetical protein
MGERAGDGLHKAGRQVHKSGKKYYQLFVSTLYFL